jgi:hypothetical protein
VEGHERRRRGMAPVCLPAGLITLLCQTKHRPAPNQRTYVVFAEHRAREVSAHPTVTAKVARYIEIHRQLKDEPRGSRRTALVRESLALRTAPMLGAR